MPTIKPFCALKPAVYLQSAVVTRPLENYSINEARLIASENRYTFLHLIDPELDTPYLRGTRQELVYKKISENLEEFLENQFLVKQNEPALYIYRVRRKELEQTGIWTLTHIEDYLEGRIKRHESTVERRESLLADYLQQTGLDANPVLITYHPDQIIDSITDKYVRLKPDLDFVFGDGTIHQVWAISEKQDLKDLINAFGGMQRVYIADGHHRAASMAKMGLQKQALNKEHHTGTEGYNYFTTVYMNTREVKILEFNRLIRDLGDLDPGLLIGILKQSFVVHESSTVVKPSRLHEMGMYFNGKWYMLEPKQEIYNERDPVKSLDVSILQDFVLAPILNIKDSRTDARIAFEGGRTPISELQLKVDNGFFVLAFTLFPVSIKQVIAVADANGIMPPKSTWVEPKFLVGLLTNYFN